MTYLMHTISGDVASRDEWKDDFNSMDVESWFGLPADECGDLHWLDDQPCLIEVERVNNEWVDA